MTQWIPRSSTDRLLLTIFLAGGHLYLWYEFCVVCAAYHKHINSSVVTHCLVASYIYVQIMGNVLRMRLASLSGEPKRRRTLRTPSWRYCDVCQDYFPPRSHHCSFCNVCVLRRDHHCWFSGCCVGATNQHFYVPAVTYIGLAALYGNVLNLQYIEGVLPGHALWRGFCVLAPHVALLTGQLTAWQFFVCVMTLLGYLVNVLTIWLLGIQLVQITANQTKYERKKGIRIYDAGTWQNVHAVLGPQWYRRWLWPWAKSEPLDDGMSYYTGSKAD